jgi:uncharacterized RDD family membrane protein YckC
MNYASFFDRVLARLTDAFIVGLITFLLGILISIFFAPFRVILFIFIYIFMFSYPIIFWVKNDGATYGQKLLGIKVITNNKEKLSYSKAIIRQLSYILLVGSLVSVIWIFFDKKKQAWHDKIAETYVVKTGKSSHYTIAIIISIIFIAYYIGCIFIITKQLQSVLSKQNVKQNGLDKQMQVNNFYDDKFNIGSYVRSNCGLDIPIPKTTDEKDGSVRKWVYEEGDFNADIFGIFNNNVLIPEDTKSSYLTYKKIEKDISQNIDLGVEGYVLFCTDNKRLFTQDEYALALQYNVGLKIKNQGKEDKSHIDLTWMDVIGIRKKVQLQNSVNYIGLSKDKKKLLFIIKWKSPSVDEISVKINKDSDMILRNLNYSIN